MPPRRTDRAIILLQRDCARGGLLAYVYFLIGCRNRLVAMLDEDWA